MTALTNTTGDTNFAQTPPVGAHHHAEPNASRTPPDHAVSGRGNRPRRLPLQEAHAQPRVGSARIAQARACRRGIYERRIRLQIERIWRRRQDAVRTPLIAASCPGRGARASGRLQSIAMPAALIGAAFFAISLATNFCR